MDYDVFKAINDFTAGHDGFRHAMTGYVKASEVLFAGLILLLFFVVGRHGELWARRAAVAGMLSATIALVIAQTLSHAVDRDRPYIEHPTAHAFAGRASDPSFPSGYATGAFAIAVAIRLRSRAWGNMALALAGLLSFARIAVGSGYPSDVLGGALLGAGCALLLAIPGPRHLVDQAADLLSALWDRVTRTALAPARSR
jgi:undecaprenyl-diphosphatase